MSTRTMNPGSIVAPQKDSYLAKVIGRVRALSKSPTATYSGGGATAGAVVGSLLLGPLGAAIGGAVGGGIGGYIGAKREELEAQEAERGRAR